MAYRHAIRHICFFLLREFILTHALHWRPACCFCTLNVYCFRKSLVVHAHRARPRLPSCKRLRSKECPRRRIKWRYATTGQQQTAKQITSSAQNKMAICHSRATRDCKASNSQCADQNGVPPLPNNNRPRSKQHPVRRIKWRYATAGQQETAKQATSNERNQMAIRPYWATTDREANNIQCAERKGVPPPPNNKRPRSKQPPMRKPKWSSAPPEQQEIYSPTDRTTRKPNQHSL